MDYKIISVESRKGGVGKTTAAMNLARLLLDKKYAVLVIDVDITGTNISDSLDSSYWKDKVNPIKYKEKLVNLLKPVNLLEIYEKHFMRGDDLSSWKIKSAKSKDEAFSIDLDKINVMGSSIYEESSNDENPSIYSFKPGILFDELHAFWLVEFLQNISDSFAQVAKAKKTVIVLDNSPGYIGLNPAIQDWLTDIGPIRGKFLTVSSLDKQDLLSCSRTIEGIHSMFKDKYSATEKYFEIYGNVKNKSNISVEFNLKDKSKDFFLRLASDAISEDVKKYYNELLCENNQEYVANPQKYQALLINKVPKEIQKGAFEYDFNKVMRANENLKVMEQLLGRWNKKNIHNYFVYYDEYVYFQFIEASLSKVPINRLRRFHEKRVEEFFNSIEKILDGKVIVDKLLYNDDEYKQIEIISDNINLYQTKLDTIIDKMKIFNYQNIIRLIEHDWFPKAPFDKIRQYFSELIYYSRHRNLDFAHESDNVDQEHNYRIFKQIKRSIERSIERDNPMKDLSKDKGYNFSYNAVIYLTILPLISKFESNSLEEYLEIFEYIRKIQMERLLKTRKSDEKIFSLSQFLANENINESELEKFGGRKYFKMIDMHPEYYHSFIIDFYSLFCKAQARLIDLKNDFDFLIFILKKISIEDKYEEKVIFPYIRDILNKVIVNKTTPHLKAREEAGKGFHSANYMTEFQKVLERIAIEWEVI